MEQCGDGPCLGSCKLQSVELPQKQENRGWGIICVQSCTNLPREHSQAPGVALAGAVPGAPQLPKVLRQSSAGDSLGSAGAAGGEKL